MLVPTLMEAYMSRGHKYIQENELCDWVGPITICYRLK